MNDKLNKIQEERIKNREYEGKILNDSYFFPFFAV